jgi:glycine reductase
VQQPIQVLHYLNQYFAGIGGEAIADAPVELRREVVGAARALQAVLEDKARIVATLVGGNNYFNDERERARAGVRDAFRDVRADVVVAGPAHGCSARASHFPYHRGAGEMSSPS